MDFFTQGVNVMKMVIAAIGAVMCVMGLINYLEGYSNDNPGSKSQGQKQFVAGAGIIVVALTLVPLLANQFSV